MTSWVRQFLLECKESPEKMAPESLASASVCVCVCVCVCEPDQVISQSINNNISVVPFLLDFSSHYFNLFLLLSLFIQTLFLQDFNHNF